jgi:hypothetical protein
VLIDGEWCQHWNFEPDTHYLKLGDFFMGIVKPGKGNDAGNWVAILNNQRLGAHQDIYYCKGLVECEIVCRLSHARSAFRAIRNRAPTSMDLYPYGPWERFEERWPMKG